MRTGAISVRNGMLPETKTTEPYSPSERAKARAKPVMTAGRMEGKITRSAVCSRLAPRHAAASSTSLSRPSSTGWRVRTTKGKPMKTSTSTMPRREYAPWMPSGTRKRPHQHPRHEDAHPDVDDGRGEGRAHREAVGGQRPLGGDGRPELAEGEMRRLQEPRTERDRDQQAHVEERVAEAQREARQHAAVHVGRHG